MKWQDNAITKNLNGTYNVMHEINGILYAYNVCGKETDPLNLYSIDEVSAFWESLPDGDARKQVETEPTPPTIHELKRAKLAKITAARNDAIDNTGAPYKGLLFWADKGSKSDILFAISAFKETGRLTPTWKAMDGILPIENVGDLLGIAEAIGVHVETQFAKEFELIARVEAAETVEELNEIDIQF